MSGDHVGFRHLTINDGLSQNAIYAVTQDRQGFMWIGTKDGLSRYDGYTFTHFHHDPYDANSLSGNRVTTLFESRDGHLWIGTWNEGLNQLNRTTNTFTRYMPGPRQIMALAEGPQGDLWIGTRGDGLYRLAPEQRGRPDAVFEHIGARPGDPRGLQHGTVLDLLVDRQGTLWVSTDAGLHRLDASAALPAAITHYPTDLPERWMLPAARTDALHEDARGRLWVGTSVGISLFDRTTEHFTHYPHHHTNENWGNVKAIAEDREGRLWLAASTSLLLFDPEGEAYTYLTADSNDPEALSNPAATEVFRDRADVMWVGTNGYGLNLFDPKAARFPTFRLPPDLAVRMPGFSIRTLFEDDVDNVWIGSSSLYRWSRPSGDLTDYAHLPAARRPEHPFGRYNVWSVVRDRQGVLWFGTQTGLYRHDPSTGATRRFWHDPANPDGLPETIVFGVFEDRQGTLWAVTRNYLSRLVDDEAGRFRHHRHSERLIRDEELFPSPYEDAQGHLWLATPQGLVRFDPATETFRRYRHDSDRPGSLTTDAVFSILPDPQQPDRILWIGTAGGGLNRFDLQTETFSAFTEKDGLPNNVVYGILPDEAGNLWMSTNRGLSRFNPRDSTFKNYNVEDGLQSNEFNAGAYFRSERGELFFGGLYGFNHFYPETLRENPYAPPVVLTGLRLANRPVTFGDSSGVLKQALWHTDVLRLSHADDMITFVFAALDFSAPAKNRYAYRMEGFNDAWIEAGTERTATYTSLPPGRYTFRVRAANNDGVWNEEGASLAVVIAPPWWRTGWAYALYACLGLALALAIGRYHRNRRRAAHRLEQERLAHEHLRELDAAKSRFFANVSHEFRTPLTLTIGPLEDLRSDRYGPLRPDAGEQVALALHSARRLLRLINQILDVAQLEGGQLKLHARRGDLVPFLRGIALAFAAAAERKQIRYRVELASEPVWAAFDPDQLDKVFANLLSNTFKFTPEGGTVHLTMVLEPDGRVAVRVRDNGPGIAAAELPHIFERFYQVDEAQSRLQPGTGIGLSLAKELAELHGGTLTAESEEGFGSVFTVTLPISDFGFRISDLKGDEGVGAGDGEAPGMDTGEEQSGDGAHAPDIAPAPFSLPDLPSEIRLPTSTSPLPKSEIDRTTLLVIDDNADIRAYIRRHLAATYRLVEAADGAEALDVARRVLPDLIISDVMMPGLDGFALCEALKRDPALDYIPVILLTARATSESKIEGLEKGADAYVMKPFDMKELVARVENLIASRKRLRERFSRSRPPLPAAGADLVSADAAFLERVRAVAEAHLGDEDFGVDELASGVGLSRSQLHRRLRTLLDEAPSDLLRAIRLEHAARMLRARTGLVSEIAYAVGFRSVSHFSTCFHGVYGVTPSAFMAKEAATS